MYHFSMLAGCVFSLRGEEVRRTLAVTNYEVALEQCEVSASLQFWSSSEFRCRLSQNVAFLSLWICDFSPALTPRNAGTPPLNVLHVPFWIIAARTSCRRAPSSAVSCCCFTRNLFCIIRVYLRIMLSSARKDLLQIPRHQ